MSFASPFWLWALLLLPALALAEAWATRRDRDRTARLVARALWDRVLRRPAEGWRYLRLWLLVLGASGFVVALARPQWGIVREKVEREGVDVVLVLDTSGSMATEDLPPSRFFLARAAVMSLVSRLEGDRFGLVAFEGEAYALVPLTLDADAVGLFLETTEPGIVPGPGSSLGSGLAKGLELFVDRERRNKAMVLVSDGEDLEGDIEESVRRAKQTGVVVHTVGVGTEQGQPVPDVDREGNRTGYKKHEDGSPVVSRLHAETLEAIARGTGGRFVRLSPTDAGLGPIASAIEGMEQKGLVGEWSYRRKERYQIPLAAGLAFLTSGLLLPLPLKRRVKALRTAAAVACAALFLPSAASAETGNVWDEVTLRPRRLTAAGRKAYAQGDHKAALSAFEGAAASRPDDPQARFNVADGLYKAGKFDEAAALFRNLGTDAAAPLAGPSRYNLGNALFQKQDFAGAVQAYRDALHALPADADTRRNLELALGELKKQQEQKQQQQSQDQSQNPQQQPKAGQDQKQGEPPPRPQSDEEKERERFQKEAGMPKERAMQLLSALQQNEKDEQKKLLAKKRVTKKRTKDW